MCALNPKHHISLRLDFYTSNQSVSYEDFVSLVCNKMLEAEVLMNADGTIRVHSSNFVKQFSGEKNNG